MDVTSLVLSYIDYIHAPWFYHHSKCFHYTYIPLCFLLNKTEKVYTIFMFEDTCSAKTYSLSLLRNFLSKCQINNEGIPGNHLEMNETLILFYKELEFPFEP